MKAAPESASVPQITFPEPSVSSAWVQETMVETWRPPAFISTPPAKVEVPVPPTSMVDEAWKRSLTFKVPATVDEAWETKPPERVERSWTLKVEAIEEEAVETKPP